MEIYWNKRNCLPKKKVELLPFQVVISINWLDVHDTIIQWANGVGSQQALFPFSAFADTYNILLLRPQSVTERPTENPIFGVHQIIFVTNLLIFF